MFKAIGASITSITNVIVKACKVLEDTVGLVESEVNNLSVEQQIRMDAIVAERKQAQVEREKAEKAATRTAKRKSRANTQTQAA